MRFACIEYTTKTGKIWRHRPERPNYLCDPEKEIDPTSFGCYTSALNGEHIPLAGLIYGSVAEPPSRGQRLWQDLRRRATGAFRPYDLSTLKQFDVLLVIYQLTNDDELVRFVQRMRNAFPRTLLVSCSSPPFGRLREQWKDHPETAERYHAFILSSHFNLNVCRATLPFYRLLTKTPSLYLPQPYPVEYAMTQAQKSWGGVGGPPAPDVSPAGVSEASGHGSSPAGGESERAPAASTARWAGRAAVSRDAGAQGGPPIVYVAGDTVRPDIMTGHLIAKALQERHPELLIRVTKTPEFPLNTAFLRGARFQVVPFRPWEEHLRELGTTRLVINTDLWWTRGRVPVDCAAAGVPCVGTTSDGQAELFPDLTAGDSLDTDRLLALAERALTEEPFRTQATTKARRRLENYSYERTAARFTHAVNLALSGNLAAWQDPVWEDDVLVLPGVS